MIESLSNYSWPTGGPWIEFEQRLRCRRTGDRAFAFAESRMDRINGKTCFVFCCGLVDLESVSAEAQEAAVSRFYSGFSELTGCYPGISEAGINAEVASCVFQCTPAEKMTHSDAKLCLSDADLMLRLLAPTEAEQEATERRHSAETPDIIR